MNLTLTIEELFKLRPVITISNNILYGGPKGVGTCHNVTFNGLELVINFPCTLCKLGSVDKQRALLNLSEEIETGLTKLVFVIEKTCGVELVSPVVHKSNKRPRILSPKVILSGTEYDTRVYSNGYEVSYEEWSSWNGSSIIAFVRLVGIYKDLCRPSLVLELAKIYMSVKVLPNILNPNNINIVPTETMSVWTLMDCLQLENHNHGLPELFSIVRLAAISNCICHTVDNTGLEIVYKFELPSTQLEGYVYLLLLLDGTIEAGVFDSSFDIKGWYKQRGGNLVRLLYPVSNLQIVNKVYIGILQKKYSMILEETCSMIHDFIRVYSVIC